MIAKHHLEKTEIRIPWPTARCIICLADTSMTDEHLIPQSLGGRLTASFLCKKCNSELGSRYEAPAREDPSVRLLMDELSMQAPKLANQVFEGQRYIGASAAGDAPGYVKAGNFVVRAHSKDDGSLVQTDSDARKTVEKILRRQGYDGPLLAEALDRLDRAPENETVSLSPCLDVVKWEITGVRPNLAGPMINPIVAVKVAYEFLAGHLGTTVYKDDPPLVEARRALIEGTIDESWVSVERLEANKSRPIHGIVFEGNSPHAKVQIRLFGKLAFRVHFRRLAVGGLRAQYTHDLSTNREWLTHADSEVAAH